MFNSHSISFDFVQGGWPKRTVQGPTKRIKKLLFAIVVFERLRMFDPTCTIFLSYPVEAVSSPYNGTTN